jgi:hypothetical protein
MCVQRIQRHDLCLRTDILRQNAHHDGKRRGEELPYSIFYYATSSRRCDIPNEHSVRYADPDMYGIRLASGSGSWEGKSAIVRKILTGILEIGIGLLNVTKNFNEK